MNINNNNEFYNEIKNYKTEDTNKISINDYLPPEILDKILSHLNNAELKYTLNIDHTWKNLSLDIIHQEIIKDINKVNSFINFLNNYLDKKETPNLNLKVVYNTLKGKILEIDNKYIIENLKNCNLSEIKFFKLALQDKLAAILSLPNLSDLKELKNVYKDENCIFIKDTFDLADTYREMYHTLNSVKINNHDLNIRKTFHKINSQLIEKNQINKAFEWGNTIPKDHLRSTYFFNLCLQLRLVDQDKAQQAESKVTNETEKNLLIQIKKNQSHNRNTKI